MLGLTNLAALFAVTMQASPTCDLPFRVVPDADAARVIAEAIFHRAPPSDSGFLYNVTVQRHPTSDVWVAFEGPITDQLMLGGGGWSMHIDACNGKVSRVLRQQ